ncbi:glycosyltransferase [Streptomyces sp. ST2-7A]|uniref:glycosyltransferase n=1 Tax=Streptomyces sp. ST2-7A TaxID=2907214 RepID=UPI001F2BB5B8|nr:glycosyltransferase [Streptomyces sp. ST2-7A]MCE7080811.1 glycosyltransferase [Streptomyces sp. ST2-7A]
MATVGGGLRPDRRARLLPSPVPPRRPRTGVLHLLGAGEGHLAPRVRALAGALPARGIRATVCAPAELVERGGLGGLVALGAEVVPLPRGSLSRWAAELRARSAEVDVVHAHGPAGGLPAVSAALRRRLPLVVGWPVRPVGDHPDTLAPGGRIRAGLRRAAERRVAGAATVVLADTPELLDHARRRGARDARLAPAPVPRPPAMPRPGDRVAAEERAVALLLAVYDEFSRPRGS